MNTSLKTLEKILYGLDAQQLKGIEIGPLARPLVHKEGSQVEYVDRASTEEIKKWYSKAKNLDHHNIVEIDHVWGDNTLAEATGKSSFYDYCLAAHVIEHVPDLIGWLAEIATILKPGGIASFSVPDRRYTFDYLRQESSLGDIIEAYLDKRRRPSIRHIFDHFSNFTEINVVEAWRSGFDGSTLRPEKSQKEVFEICRDAQEAGKYVDSHCWVFTADSFITLLQSLSEMGLLDFRISRFFGVEENNHEFVVQLEKLPDTLDSEEKAQLFAQSFCRTKPHKIVFDITSSADSTAQLYYDTGAGFSERESTTLPVSRNKRTTLCFPLPTTDILALRFDPAMCRVKVIVHDITFYHFAEKPIALPVNSLRPLSHIRKITYKDDKAIIRSAPLTNDPSLTFNLPDIIFKISQIK